MSLLLTLLSLSLEVSDNIVTLTSKNNKIITETINEKEYSPSFDVKQNVIKTNFKDSELIRQAMVEYGLNLTDTTNFLSSLLQEGSITFKKNNEGTFNAIFTGNFEEEDINDLMKSLNEEYAKVVQEDTYNKVIDRIKENNMTLENETVASDDSIVLTLDIN